MIENHSLLRMGFEQYIYASKECTMFYICLHFVLCKMCYIKLCYNGILVKHYDLRQKDLELALIVYLSGTNKNLIGVQKLFCFVSGLQYSNMN